MTKRHAIALAVGLAAMLFALLPPLWIRATGEEVVLALRPVDPLSLFRGNYVDLDYDVDIEPPGAIGNGDAVFVVFEPGRPARAVAVFESVPELTDDQICIRGRATGRGVEFPELEQFFVTAEQGRVLERNMGTMVGVVRATDSCRAVLVSVEPE